MMGLPFPIGMRYYWKADPAGLCMGRKRMRLRFNLDPVGSNPLSMGINLLMACAVSAYFFAFISAGTMSR
jgi:hypothetical protein